ncbi:MAG: methionine--tRNA ligase [Limisphaerales bacterium]
MSKRFYITTAIDYVNGQPHLGHAYEKVIADVIARSHRSLGEEVYFLTGLDEHGQKVQQAAEKEGKTAQAYCDELAKSWQALATKLGLSNDDFIRTTQPRHQAVVQAILQHLYDQGQFYKETYKGWYSPSAETFLTEKDRLPDGTFDAIYGKVIELEEVNYYFKLAPHQDWLINYIETNPDFVQPSYRRNEVLGFLKKEKLEDLCVTRPKSRLTWGIPVPFDSNYVTYVWFDALVNYVTVPGGLGDPKLSVLKAAPSPNPSAPAGTELWPADIHLIGKDIIKFHTVYWPIMLKALGLPLPKQVLAHGWWQKNGEKMSKSTGNVVDPIAVIDEWGLDAFRYYVVRELDIGPDGNWTDASFQARYQSELANGIGNLLNRSLTMIKKYRNGALPDAKNALATEIAKAQTDVIESYRKHALQDALVQINALITRANQYIQQTEPFKMAKDPAKAAELDNVLYTLAEAARVIAILLWPVLPGASEKIQQQLGITKPTHLFSDLAKTLPAGHVVNDAVPLFPRKDQKPA